MQYKTILFDLDGTLTDSAPGILNSVRYGCRRIGIPVPDEATLRRFLGPPLIDSFHNLCGLNDADTDRAVAAFREYFPDKGLFENEVYPGIPALLADLHARGCQLVLATSKPEEYARRIMEHFDLAQYFTAICGATLDETRTDKAEVIAYADKANERMQRKYYRIAFKSRHNIAKTAIARELACFVWGMMTGNISNAA